jgi:hypothetical protein
MTEKIEPESAPFLFSKETIEALTHEEKVGCYTLERLKVLRPEVIPEVIRLRGEHCGLLRISRILQMHHKTVSAICAEYPEEIAVAQQRRADRLRSAADKLIEQLDESPENVPWNVKGLAASQLYDKAAMIEGSKVLRVDHMHRVDFFSDFKEFVRQLEEREDPIDIKPSNASSEIGPSGQNNLAIRDFTKALASSEAEAGGN